MELGWCRTVYYPMFENDNENDQVFMVNNNKKTQRVVFMESSNYLQSNAQIIPGVVHDVNQIGQVPFKGFELSHTVTK